MDAEKLAKDHWSYIKTVLWVHRVEDKLIDLCGTFYIRGFLDGCYGNDYQDLNGIDLMLKFHYSSAYTHGAKHRLEEEKSVDQSLNKPVKNESKISRLFSRLCK